ncbi:DUF5955 family protein [Streptomyces sp. NPDC006175]|uniref:DUF5955 family protein n=1 Tax=unclassified Streptomyces TaxID=2593676 RepID=UPI0033A4382D
MSGEQNIGIYQAGSGKIDNSGTTVAGSGAKVSVTTDGPATAPDGLSPSEALAALRELLAVHGRELPDADRARARGELEEVADELAADEPDRGRLAGALDRLGTALGSVAGLAAAAEALKQAVTGLFA